MNSSYTTRSTTGYEEEYSFEEYMKEKEAELKAAEELLNKEFKDYNRSLYPFPFMKQDCSKNTIIRTIPYNNRRMNANIRDKRK